MILVLFPFTPRDPLSIYRARIIIELPEDPGIEFTIIKHPILLEGTKLSLFSLGTWLTQQEPLLAQK